jgi:DNA helicase-2/ATP-dependent DNA helicase PcrA
MRIINVPRRTIGDKTVREIVATAEKKKISQFEVCVKIANGQSIVQGITIGQRKGLRSLVELVRDGRKKADEARCPCSTLFSRTLTLDRARRVPTWQA